MKKTTLQMVMLCLCMVLGIATSKAQTQTKAQAKATDKAADNLCKCVNDHLDKLNPTIKQMIVDMAELGQEKAQENMTKAVLAMSAADQAKVMKSAEDLQKPAFQQGIEKCFEDFKKKNPDFKDADGLVKALHNKPKCRFVDDLMKIGESQNKETTPSKE